MFNRILLPLDRSALARVMLQTPQLIVFDEATSLWDNTNEVMSATKGLFQDFLQQKSKSLDLQESGNGQQPTGADSGASRVTVKFIVAPSDFKV